MKTIKLELSRDLTKAHTRITSLQGIDENLDLGNGCTLVNYKAAHQRVQEAVDAVNQTIDELADKRRLAKQAVRELRDWNNRMLGGVGSRYGKDSIEYEQAGGTRTSKKVRQARGQKKEG